MIPLAMMLLVPMAGDDGEKEARALLLKGIEALGGEKLLSKSQSLTGTSKGTIHLGGRQEVSNRWTVQGLAGVRWETELGGDSKSSIILGMSKGKVWISGNGGEPNAVSKETAEAFRRGFLALRAAEELVPLKAWKLSHLGELKVKDTPAIGLKASRKGEPDIDLFFDKKTLLPVKVEVRLKKPGESEEMTLVGYLSGYKKIEGRQHFTRLEVEQDEKKVLEMERADIKAGAKVDEATFERP